MTTKIVGGCKMTFSSNFREVGREDVPWHITHKKGLMGCPRI